MSRGITVSVDINLTPETLKNVASVVNVTADHGIRCERTDATSKDPVRWAWYCTAAVDSPLGPARIFAEVNGTFGQTTESYNVNITANTAPPPTTSTVVPSETPIPATATTVNIAPGEVKVTDTPPAQPCKDAICITSPKSKESVSGTTLVEGTLQKPLATGEEVWVLIVPGDTKHYHPQSGSTVTNLVWSVSATVGQSQDQGKTFTIYAGIADPTAAKAFADYLDNAAKNKRWDGIDEPDLPKGFKAQSIDVTRKK